MSGLHDGPLVAWVGDDFTGSAAALEVLEFAGLPSVLFTEIPTEAKLKRFEGRRGLGVATTARSQSPESMDKQLPAIFEFLKDTGAGVVHYKTCSTLDSAPEVGSIGRAIEIGSRVFGGGPVPCVIAAPEMRRYQVFGNLFASADKTVYRLDRHPVMARHPVTPMDEADVVRHLGRQTDMHFGLVTVEDLAGDAERAWQREVESGAEVICLDAMSGADMAANGKLIWGKGRGFAVGSQGVEYALVAHWRKTGLIPNDNRTQGVGPVDRLLVVSGSVSPITARQIEWAKEHGFVVMPLAPDLALGGGQGLEGFLASVQNALDRGRDVVVCSARGPDDPAVAQMRALVADRGIDPTRANAAIGAALGTVLKRCVKDLGLRRAVVSGGDTSGFATGNLGLFAFTALAPTIPGASLLTGHSDDAALDGLQLALKGGQMGTDDFFGWIKRGEGTASGG